MANTPSVILNRVCGLGIPAPIAIEFVNQINASDGSGYNLVDTNRLMNLGIEPIAAKSIQTELNGSGLLTKTGLVKGAFLTPDQVNGLLDIFNQAPVEISAPVLTDPEGLVVGDKVYCDIGQWDSPTPVVGVEWQWYGDGVLITDTAVDNYTLASGDVGKMITCIVIVENRGDQTSSSESNAVGPVLTDGVPINLTLPVITGPNTPPLVGDTLTCSQGTWNTATAITATEYDFRVDGVSEQKSAANTFTLINDYLGFAVDCVVKVTNSVGESDGATSNATDPVE